MVGGYCLSWVAVQCLPGLLFQEYPSILWVESYCISDTSASPGLGSSVTSARAPSRGSGWWTLPVRARCSRTRLHAPLTVVSRFFSFLILHKLLIIYVVGGALVVGIQECGVQGEHKASAGASG